ARQAALLAIVLLATSSATAQREPSPFEAMRSSPRTAQTPTGQSAQPASTAQHSAPRTWLIVLGSVLFVPTYGASIYFAASGDATSYGPVRPGESQGQYRFGTAAWLYVPVVGPFAFDSSFCSDARAFFAQHPIGDEPGSACGGSFW